MTPIEAMARALAANWREYPAAKDIGDAWSSWPDALKEPWLRSARAWVPSSRQTCNKSSTVRFSSNPNERSGS